MRENGMDKVRFEKIIQDALAEEKAPDPLMNVRLKAMSG